MQMMDLFTMERFRIDPFHASSEVEVVNCGWNPAQPRQWWIVVKLIMFQKQSNLENVRFHEPYSSNVDSLEEYALDAESYHSRSAGLSRDTGNFSWSKSVV